jgi:tRNA-uridine 2-sulfurtransferase
MSGGVDSLRTAILLKEQGHEVLGIHMRILPSSPNGRWCTESTIEEREEALRSLAARIDIPLTIVDIRDAFEAEVILPFLETYRQGLTPNPCVVCNPRIKFGLLLQEARSLGADRFATGHYVRVLAPDPSSERFRLCRATDLSKDQSYFLFGLSQEQLAHAMFPLGSIFKKEVLGWAVEEGFQSILPEESQEICFIPSGNHLEFLQERLDSGCSAGGPIVDMEGKQLGEHKGLFAYTIGQRRGLGIASTAPYYVIAIESSTNTLRIGRSEDLFRQEFTTDEINWVSIAPPDEPLHCQVRIRHQHRPASAWVIPRSPLEALVKFDEPQRSVTPGQASVFYDGDLLLGGGVIQTEMRE